ncbi:MAG: hypothetical protein KIT35_20185 [Piscinibacter sp.]|uniref:hypothetical protein n=1 Tax=Piscinibacter TaxID=1114981 RepID=UPI000FDD8C87|nr:MULTISPECIES: hypothetical protein [Piscinibacter]MCW5666156.1 hypothetical protein [Piscinibacter sp.]
MARLTTPSAFRPLRVLAAALLVLAALPAAAQDGLRMSASAFATLGWAQSDNEIPYQGIADGGTVRRDSVFGAQLDLQFSPRWSATVQARLAPSPHHESAWDLRASWAFVAWRPDNDWLLRLGKVRVPLYLRSENLDVGQTYDEVRLPAELYTLAPTNDFTGANLARSWGLDNGELTLEAYFGRNRLTKRFWLRAGVPPQLPPGPLYREVETTVQGLVATWRAPRATARVGIHHARTEQSDGSRQFLVRPTWAPLGPGVGYWQTSSQLPGPGVENLDHISNLLLMVGGELHLGSGWRVASELGRVWQRHTEMGLDAAGGYLSLYRSIGRFTPYASVAAIHTLGASQRWSRELEGTTVPGVVPGADLLNASMRVSADTVPIYDQSSLALGSSYALNTNSKLKLEWQHVWARRSSMFDLPAGEPIDKRRGLNVWSASVDVVF